MIQTATATVATARQLRTDLLAAGFKPGKPAHVFYTTLQDDLASCRRLRCPGCHRRTMRGEPFHSGRAYKLLAVCQDVDCRSAEEV